MGARLQISRCRSGHVHVVLVCFFFWHYCFSEPAALGLGSGSKPGDGLAIIRGDHRSMSHVKAPKGKAYTHRNGWLM